MRETRDVLKVFEDNGHIVGAYIVGPHAGELIAEAALSIIMGLKTRDIKETIHAHPTLSESYVDALTAMD